MEMMSDESLDRLIGDAVERRETVSQINANVMKAVGREHRRVSARRVLRMVALCVGVSLVLLLPIAALLAGSHGQVTTPGTIVTVGGLLFFYVPVVRVLNNVF